MPLWLSISLLSAAVLAIVYLLYLVVCNKRWIRLHAFTAFAAGYFALPAFKLVIKAYGFDVDAAWNDSSWTKDALAALVLTYLFWLEYNYQKGESHQKYFHDFYSVVLDNIRDGIPAETIAKNRNVPLEKVQAIIISAAWFEQNIHQKNQANGK